MELQRLQPPWRDFETFASKNRTSESEGILEGRIVGYLN
jgi:hypothetical protein